MDSRLSHPFVLGSLLIGVLLVLTVLQSMRGAGSDAASMAEALYEDGALFLRGDDLSSFYENIGRTLSPSDPERAQVMDALVSNALAGTFGDFSTLSLPPNSFGFVIRDFEWLLTIDGDASELVDQLHSGFSSRYSPALVRERELPDGTVARDIVADEEGVISYEEEMYGGAVRLTIYVREGKEFLTAQKKHVRLISNSRDLIRRALK